MLINPEDGKKEGMGGGIIAMGSDTVFSLAGRAVGGVLFLAASTLPVSAAQLYDFSRFFNEPHPFYGTQTGGPVQPVPVPGQPFAQRPRFTPAQGSPAYSGANAVPPRSRGIESSMQNTNPSYRKPLDGFYASLMLAGGYSLIDDSKLTGGSGVLTVRSDTDFTAGPGVALGYNWSEFGWPVRTELEYHFRFRTDFGSRDTRTFGTPSYENNISSHSLLLNIYYDYVLNPRWVLYGGAGIGIARNTSDVKRVLVDIGGAPVRETSHSKTGLSWNVGLGALWRWKENWTIDMRYRFVDLGEIEAGPLAGGETVSAESFVSHDLVIGFIYDF